MLSHDNSDTKGKDGIDTPATLNKLSVPVNLCRHVSVLEARIANSESDSEGKSR